MHFHLFGEFAILSSWAMTTFFKVLNRRMQGCVSHLNGFPWVAGLFLMHLLLSVPTTHTLSLRRAAGREPPPPTNVCLVDLYWSFCSICVKTYSLLYLDFKLPQKYWMFALSMNPSERNLLSVLRNIIICWTILHFTILNLNSVTLLPFFPKCHISNRFYFLEHAICNMLAN